MSGRDFEAEAKRLLEERARLVGARVDRVDGRGNIREHTVARKDPTKTVCGITIGLYQAPGGNPRCGRCERLEQAATREGPPKGDR